MASDAASTFFIAGTVPFIVAGGAHAAGALWDTRRPTFFKPIDESVISAMSATGVRLRAMLPGRQTEKPTTWQAWLGFNVSHGVGAALFGVLLLLIAVHDFDLVTEIPALQPLSIAVALGYFLMSLRFWFYGPAIVTGSGTACFVVSALA